MLVIVLGANEEEQDISYDIKYPLNKKSSGNLLKNSVLFTHAQTESTNKFSTHNTAESPSVSALVTTPKNPSFF